MSRYKFCSLSKYHIQPCHFEWDFRFEPCPVEPRCMKRSQPISEFERSPFLEPSYVRNVYVPFYVNEPADKVAGRPRSNGRGGSFDIVDLEHHRHRDLPKKLVMSEAVRKYLSEALAEQVFGAPKIKVPVETTGRGVSIDQISHDEVPPKKPFSLVTDLTEEQRKTWDKCYRAMGVNASVAEQKEKTMSWDQHRRAHQMRLVRDGEGLRFKPGRDAVWPRGETFIIKDQKVERMRRPNIKIFGPLLLLVLLLTGCQGWMHGGELALHGPDPRVERAVRSSHKVVLDVLEADFEAVEQANVTDPRTGEVTRENLEKQFRLMRFKALQIATIDKLMRAIAEYNGVDIDSKPGSARSEAGERAKQLRDLLEDVAKEQGKDLGDELLDGLR